MKVAVLFNGVREMTGGARSVANLIDGLRDQGMDPMLVTDCESELTEIVRAGSPVEVVALPPRLQVRDHGVMRYGALQKASAASSALRYSLRLSRKLKALKVDCLIARNCKNVLLAGPGCRLSGIPLVWDVCLESPPTRLMQLLQKVAYSYSALVVCEARCQWQTLFGGAKKKLRYATPGLGSDRITELLAVREVRTNRDRLIPERGQIKILCVSSITPRKNQALLIESLAASGVANRYVVSFVGAVHDGSYDKLLREMAEQTGVGASFLGWHEKVASLISEADLLILPSKDEGVPNIIREAMVAGLPVIATPVGGIPDIVRNGETGLLLDGDWNLVLAKSLADIANGRIDLDGLVIQAGREAENFTVPVWTKRYAGFLRDLLTLKPKRSAH